MLRRLRALLVLSALVLGLLLAAPGAVLADCMPPPPIEEAVKTADIVFIGTVTETANRGTWATVTVKEVWRGPDQPATVVIRGGPAGNAATSVDRTFEAGVEYIFLPYIDQEQGGLTDNSCSNTQPWAEAMAALRPAEVRQPAVAPAAGEGGFELPLLPIAVVGVVFLAMLGVGLLARGRSDA